MELDALFIETLYEWEAVFSAKLSNEEITERRRKVMQLKHGLEAKHFPTGDLPDRADLFALAEQDAINYLQGMFGDGDEA